MDKKVIMKYLGGLAFGFAAFGLGLSIMCEVAKADYEVKASNTLVSGDPDLSAYYGQTIVFSSTSDIPRYIVADEPDPVEDVPVSELAFVMYEEDNPYGRVHWVLRYFDSESNYYNVSPSQVFVYANEWIDDYDNTNYGYVNDVILYDGMVAVYDDDQLIRVSVYVNDEFQQGYSSAVADLTETDFVQDRVYTGFTRKTGIDLPTYYTDFANFYNSYTSGSSSYNYCAGFNNGYDLDWYCIPTVSTNGNITTYGLRWRTSEGVYSHLIDGVSFDSDLAVYYWFGNVSSWSTTLPSEYSWEYFPHSVSGASTYYTSYFTNYYEPLNLIADAYADGYGDGSSDGYVNGYNEGSSAGYEVGYNVGFNEGSAAENNTIDLSNTFNTIVNMPFRFVQTAFHIDLPLSNGSYFNIGGFLLGIFGIVLIFKVAQLVFSVFR